MATRFEFVLYGENPVSLRAAGEEAIEEIHRLEARLSLYKPSSEIAHVNARAAREPVRVTPCLFVLLEHAEKLSAETSGAFDITIAPLVRCWGFMGGSGKIPSDQELAEARSKVGMHLVQLNRADFTVRFATPGVMLDLGAIGKGYAIDRATEILREAGVTSALLHSGTSTVSAIGTPPGEEAWKIAIENPAHQITALPPATSSPVSRASPPASCSGVSPDANRGHSQSSADSQPLTTISLKNESLSVSAIWGKSFQAGGRTLGHVLDPRTGTPVTGALLAAVTLPSATETDALSTALLTLGPQGHESFPKLRPGIRTLLVTEVNGSYSVESNASRVC
jgi:thiamine biosynthesis lipoprotein